MSKNIKSGSDVANPVIPPVQWAEDQVNDLSFRAVDPVSVLVKDLNVTIDVSPGGLSTSPPPSIGRQPIPSGRSSQFSKMWMHKSQVVA